MEGIPLSPKGRSVLTAELDELKNVKAPKVRKDIAEFRALGDLSENAPYHAAREELALIEARISEVEDVLGRSFIVDRNRLPKDRIVFGTRVTVENLENHQEEVYYLVGEGETNPDEGWILTTSPLGQAFMGKKKGEEIVVEIPAGEATYCIKDFSFIDSN